MQLLFLTFFKWLRTVVRVCGDWCCLWLTWLVDDNIQNVRGAMRILMGKCAMGWGLSNVLGVQGRVRLIAACNGPWNSCWAHSANGPEESLHPGWGKGKGALANLDGKMCIYRKFFLNGLCFLTMLERRNTNYPLHLHFGNYFWPLFPLPNNLKCGYIILNIAIIIPNIYFLNIYFPQFIYQIKKILEIIIYKKYYRFWIFLI